MPDDFYQKTYEVERNRIELFFDQFVELFDTKFEFKTIKDLRVDDLLLEALVLCVWLTALCTKKIFY